MNPRSFFPAASILITIAFSLVFAGCTKTNPTNNSGSGNSGGSGGSGGSGTSYTSITYKNDAFTPIAITLGDSSANIAVGASVTFKGKSGSTITGQASTSGHTAAGGTVGTVINWTLNETFPSTGNTNKTIDVSPSYFFLKVNNTSAYNVTGIYVNYGLTPQTFDNISFGSGMISVGYYPAYTNSNVRCISSTSGYWQVNTNLTGGQNQSFTFTLTN